MAYSFNVSPYGIEQYKTELNPSLNTAAQAESTGFGYGAGALKQMSSQSYNYPDNYASQLRGPAQQITTQYVSNPAYQRVEAPSYQGYSPQSTYTAGPELSYQYKGLLGGDYDALQSAMEAPVYQSYNRALTDINNAAAGQGLYGSTGQGLQSDQISQAAQNILTPGLSAASQARYSMQMSDDAQRAASALQAAQYGQSEAARNQAYQQFMDTMGQQNASEMNQFNASLFPQLVAQNQAQYTSGVADALRQQEYLQGAADRLYQNQQSLSDFYNNQLATNYNLSAQEEAYQRGLLQDFLTNSLALAGKATPSTSAQNAYQAQLENMAAQQAMNKSNNQAQLYSGLTSGVGGLLGGLLAR